MHNDSNINPKVFKSLIKSFGPIPNAATPIEGSAKYLVSEVLVAILLRKLGFQAGLSSTTKILFKALT